MLALLYVFIGLVATAIIMTPVSEKEQQNMQAYASALSANMIYYHSMAESRCLNSSGTFTCTSAGFIKDIPSRVGATPILQYGNNIKSWTDGKTFIATTICGNDIGKAYLPEIYGWMRSDLKKSIDNNFTLGHYQNGLIQMDFTLSQNESGGYVEKNTYPIVNNPCGTLYTNQPILYTYLF